jgi:hypothetical protein
VYSLGVVDYADLGECIRVQDMDPVAVREVESACCVVYCEVVPSALSSYEVSLG